MTDQFAEFRTLANDLLKENGRTLQIARYENNAPPDVTKPWRLNASTPTFYDLWGCVIPVKISFRTPPGEPSFMAYLSALNQDGKTPLAIEPQRTDVLLRGNDAFAFELINPLDPSGTGNIIYVAKVTLWPAISSAQPTRFSAP